MTSGQGIGGQGFGGDPLGIGDLRAAQAAVADALADLALAGALTWTSPAAEVFRKRLGVLTARTRRDAQALDNLALAVTRLGMRA